MSMKMKDDMGMHKETEVRKEIMNLLWRKWTKEELTLLHEKLIGLYRIFGWPDIRPFLYPAGYPV